MKIIIPEAALGQHIAILGKTGRGKTSTGKLLVEQVVTEDEARVCILDTVKSDWWGLISSADGKKPGLPFHILGGPRGHVPLHSGAGKAIAELVATGALRHSIIDMADFEAGGVQRFFVDFAPALLRHMRGVLYLVMEEAHELAPKERSGFEKENMAIHFAKKLATAGRSKGIRMVILTQRTQALHNALLGSCETLIAHGFTAPADQEPVVKWLKSNLKPERAAEVAASLSSLRTGEAWICGGESQLFERRQFPRIKTYDNSATPTNDSHQHEVKTAPVDADKLRSIIGDAMKEAEANDPKALKAQNAILQKQLAQRMPAADPQALHEAHERGRALGRADTLQALQAPLDRMATLAGGLVDQVQGLKDDSKRLAAAQRREAVPPAPRQREASVPPAPRASGSSEVGNSGLRRMLIALAQRPSGLSRRQLGVRAGMSSRSGTFDTYLSKARSSGWVDGRADEIRITPTGTQALGTYEPLPTGRELLAYWLAELGQSGAARILRALADVYPREMTRPELGTAANMSDRSGTFDTYLSKLRSLELIEGRGLIKASEELFDG